MTYTSPTYRTVCEKCGRVTLTKMSSEVQVILYKDELGAPMMVTFCPEHRAEWVRLLSDFLEGVPT